MPGYREFFVKFLFFTACLILISCNLTQSLWKGGYKEKFRQFLVSNDGRHIVFISKKYHYVFDDNSNLLQQLLVLDRDHVVTIDDEKTHIVVDRLDNLSSHITIKTFDLNLSEQQLDLLKFLGFKKLEEEGVLFLEVQLKGKRYPADKDSNSYFALLKEFYEIEIYRSPTLLGEVEKIVLTPVAVVADTVILFGKIILFPFGE
jgi:hypothetical protein